MRRHTMISLTPASRQHFTIFPTAAEEVASQRRDRDAFVDDAEISAIDAVTNCESLKVGLMPTRFYALGNVRARRPDDRKNSSRNG